jgi:transcriptional regulator with XRE-family HTH domain
MTQNTFGEFIKVRRLQKEIPLRAFSNRIGMDPSNYSRIEKSVDQPPSNPTRLHSIARELDIQIDSDDYKEMERLADIGRGEIPRQILSNDQLVGKLPVFFRAIGQDEMNEEKLDQLIETIRKEF